MHGVEQAPEISVEEFKRRADQKENFILLDVREPQEYKICRLENSRLIPLGELPTRMGELDASRDLVVYCKLGGRSARAVQALRAAGFDRAVSLKGGVSAWAERIDPNFPKY